MSASHVESAVSATILQATHTLDCKFSDKSNVEWCPDQRPDGLFQFPGVRCDRDTPPAP